MIRQKNSIEFELAQKQLVMKESNYMHKSLLFNKDIFRYGDGGTGGGLFDNCSSKEE